MSDERVELTIVMPAFNEEKQIGNAVKNALNALDDYAIKGELIIINDGSGDRTKELIEQKQETDSRIRLINHSKCQGIGSSFWTGVDEAAGDSIVMLPGDNENDPWEILRYNELLRHVDIVIPFVFNKQVRSIFRNALSSLYRLIINATFRGHFNYTNGTILYRRSVLKELEHRSSGFFFQTDILIRSIKRGYLFAEVPYRLDMRREGVSKAVSFPSLLQVAKGYLHLVRDIYFRHLDRNVSKFFAPDSLTFKRRQKEKLNEKFISKQDNT